MKKGVFVLCLIACVSSAFAQGGKVIKAGVKLGTQSDVALRVAQKVGQLTVSSPVATTVLAQITNLPGQPTVKVQLPHRVANVTGVLPMHTVQGRQVYKQLVFSDKSQVYIPISLNSGKQALYRGLRLRNLDELKNILVNGLESNKSMWSQIFFSNSLYFSLGHASDPLPDIRSADQPRLAVIVQVVIDQQSVLAKFKRADYSEYVLLNENLPADKLTDVMVFLEVNGKWDWYKAILQDGEIFFQQAPNRMVNISDLFEYDIEAERIYWE